MPESSPESSPDLTPTPSMRGIYRTPEGYWAVKLSVHGVKRYVGTFRVLDAAVTARDAAVTKILAELGEREPRNRPKRERPATRPKVKGVSSDEGKGLGAKDDSEVQWRIALERRHKTDERRPFLLPGWQYAMVMEAKNR